MATFFSIELPDTLAYMGVRDGLQSSEFNKIITETEKSTNSTFVQIVIGHDSNSSCLLFRDNEDI